jgi:conjugative transfer pilus assembly protein TraH
MSRRGRTLRLFKALACSGLVLTAWPAKADLSTALGDMLSVNIHVNNGGAVSTMKRGGFYGGSVYVRGKITDVAVVNFTPPSFASNCGGIDLFGGSFSMINAQQFVQLLRNIAQNAAAYAFELALKNICEQCATIVSGLQKSIQAMNEFTGNSCQIAQGIVNAGIDALELKDVKGMQGTTLTKGWNDSWGAFWGGLQQSVTALNVNVGGVNVYQDKYSVNVTWKAIQDLNARFVLPSNTEVREAMMTLVGSVILEGPANDSDGNPSRHFQKLAPGRLTVRDLVYGASGVSMYSCNDILSNTGKCLTPTTGSEDIKGLLEHLQEAYLGTGMTDTSSIMWKLMNGTPADKDQAQTDLVTKLGSVGSMIIKLALVSPPGSSAPYLLFDRNKEYIAIELAQLFVTQTIAAIEQELKQEKYDVSYADDWIRNDFQNAKDSLESQLTELAASVPQPPMEEFIAMFNYSVNTNPFVN